MTANTVQALELVQQEPTTVHVSGAPNRTNSHFGEDDINTGLSAVLVEA